MDVQEREVRQREESITYISLKMLNYISSEKSQNTTSKNAARKERENSMQEDRISRKSEHFCSGKPSTICINVPLENNRNPNNRQRHKKRYFCCGSLAEGAIASANYSNVISVVMIIYSLHLFFHNSEDDDGLSKALAFSAVVYAICYIRSSTNLKRAIDEEQREKIIPWILFTILTIFLLLSEAVYVSVTYWEELDDFDEDMTVPCLRLILIAFLGFVGCTLIYCVYGVVRLFKSMAGGEVAAHSLMNDIRSFINGVSV